MNSVEAEICVSLRLAPDEPTVREPESREQLQRLYEGLQAAGITEQHQMHFRDAVGGPVDLLAHFVVPIAQIVIPVWAASWEDGYKGVRVERYA